jgi:FXSXX-COOH protein
MGDEDLDIESDLFDLSRLDLELLPTLHDSVLAHAIRRILRTAENPDEATLGFQQSI